MLLARCTSHLQGIRAQLTSRTGIAAGHDDKSGWSDELLKLHLQGMLDCALSAWRTKEICDLQTTACKGAYPANAVGLALSRTGSSRLTLPQTLEPWDEWHRMSLNVLQTTWAWILLWSGRCFRMLVSSPSGRSMRQGLDWVNWPTPMLM